MVGVLILVHQYIAEFLLVVFPHFSLLLQKGDSVVDDIVKIKGISRPELLRVLGVDLGNAGHLPVHLIIVLCRKLFGTLVLILGAADNAEDTLGLEGLFIQIQLFQNVLDDPLGVIGVVDGKILVKADAVNVPPQDADTGGVEGRGPDIVGHGSQTGRQAFLQLPCRLVGKGDGDDLPGPGHIHSAEPVSPLHLRIVRVLREVLQKV